MTATANSREALVKRQDVIDALERVRANYLPDHRFAVNDCIDAANALLTAPAEAPVAWRTLHNGEPQELLNEEPKLFGVDVADGWTVQSLYAAPRQQDARSATEYADVPMGPVGATYIGDTLLPCPQSAPVSREAIIDEVAKGLDGKVFACHAHDDFGKGRERGLLDAAKYVRSLAAHPAEPAKEKS